MANPLTDQYRKFDIKLKKTFNIEEKDWEAVKVRIGLKHINIGRNFNDFTKIEEYLRDYLDKEYPSPLWVIKSLELKTI
jgi:hypothetical protein